VLAGLMRGLGWQGFDFQAGLCSKKSIFGCLFRVCNNGLLMRWRIVPKHSPLPTIYNQLQQVKSTQHPNTQVSTAKKRPKKSSGEECLGYSSLPNGYAMLALSTR
jgi:hypothetical protein